MRFFANYDMLRFSAMSAEFRKRLCIGFVYLIVRCAVQAQHVEAARITDSFIADAQTVTFCEVQQYPERFKNKMIRLRVFYLADFEKSVITAASCSAPFPMTWVTFDKRWESRSKRRVRHALSSQKWGAQTDVIFIGLFGTDGRYGHMDMYPFSFEVYKVEAVGASGRFSPMPE
jgi:hypothetical protein